MMQSTTDAFLLLKALTLKIDAAHDLKSALRAVIETICQYYKWSYGEAWQLDPQTETLIAGSIKIVSELGQGTTFRFSISLEACSESSLIEQAEPHIDLSQKRLLIVDSNQTSRRYLALQARF